MITGRFFYERRTITGNNCYSGINNTLKLIIAIAIVLAAGFTSGYFTASGAGGWYATIQKFWFNAPNWIFGTV
jgi:tryptophan-rich sensory protein